MSGLIWQFILRHLSREPVRALATVIGAALGIAVIVAIELAKQTSVSSFKDSLEQMSGKAALEITTPTGVPDAAIPQLTGLRNYGVLCPVVEGNAEIVGRDTLLHILGVDILQDQQFRDYEIAKFSDGRTVPTPTEFLALLSDPSALILTEKLALRLGLGVGDQVDVLFSDTAVPMRISALLLDRGTAKAVDGGLALMDIAAAQWRLGKLGKTDRLELRLSDGADVESVKQSIAAELPDGFSVDRPARRGAEVEKMMEAYHFNLSLLGAIAFLAGMGVIYNSISLSVIARRSEIGMLRTLGLARGGTTRLFLVEALMLGIPGCIIGLFLGKWLGKVSLMLTATTAQSLFGQSGVSEPQLSLPFAMAVLLAGFFMAVLAALYPAWEAANVAPIEATRETPEIVRLAGRRSRLIKSMAFFALAMAASLLPPIAGKPIGGALACLLAVAGMSVLATDVLRLFLGLLKPLAQRLRSPAMDLAIGGLQSGVRRLGIPLSALGGTLALSTAIAIMVGSFRQTLIYWVENSLAADLFIRPAGKKSGGTEAYFSPEVLAILQANSKVELVEPLRLSDISYQNSRILLSAADWTVASQRGRLAFKDLGDWRGVLKDSIGQDACCVSESFAFRYQTAAGKTISLPTRQGSRSFQVIGVYYDYSNDRGTVMLDRGTYVRHFGEFQPTNLGVFLKPGSDADAVAEQIRVAMGTRHRVQIFTNASLRTEVLRIFDNTFSITWALEMIAILVAMAGVATTIFTLVLGRTAELKTLRQIGATRQLLHRSLTMESGLLGVVSQIIGLVLGFVLSFVLIYVINVQSFGWTIQFSPPWGLLALTCLLVPIATALAGWVFSNWLLSLAGQKRGETKIES